jgi:hypothetical protein
LWSRIPPSPFNYPLKSLNYPTSKKLFRLPLNSKGFSAKVDEKKAEAIGICAIVSKPVLKWQIVEAIGSVLDG